jgi:hypothetical protein
MKDIRHTSDNTNSNNDNRTAAENWSYMRHLSKLADQAKQQTDLVPSSPRDTDSAPSSSQDRGKRPLSAKELLEEEWCRVEPGENGLPPEKLVIPDPGYGGGMLKGVFGVNWKVKKLYKDCVEDSRQLGWGRSHVLENVIDSYLENGKYKLAKDLAEYSIDKFAQETGINSDNTKELISHIIWAYSDGYGSRYRAGLVDGFGLVVNFCERYQEKHSAGIRDIMDYMLERNHSNSNYANMVVLICERLSGPNSSKTLDAMGNLVMAYMEQFPRKEAIEKGINVYEDLVARAGRDHPKVAQVLDRMLDQAKDWLGQYCGEYSSDIYKRVIPLCERLFGPNDSKTLGAIDNMLMACMKSGYCHVMMGVEIYEDFVARAGRDHPTKIAQVLDSIIDQAKAYLRNNAYGSAIDTYERVKPFCERQFGPNSSKTLDVIGDLSMAYMKSENGSEKGINVYEDLVARAGRDHPKVAPVLDCMLDQAKADLRNDNYYCATKIYKRVIPICERQFGLNDARTLDAMCDLIMAHIRDHNRKEGTKVYEDLVARAGRDHPKIAQVLDNLLDEAKSCRYGEKRKVDIYEGILFFYEQQFGHNDPRTVECREHLALQLSIQERERELELKLERKKKLKEQHWPWFQEKQKEVEGYCRTFGRDFYDLTYDAAKEYSLWEEKILYGGVGNYYGGGVGIDDDDGSGDDGGGGDGGE